MSILWHNGIFKKDAPLFSFDDRIRLGDGVFDTMLDIDAKPIHLKLHYQRLKRHAAILGIPIALKENDFAHIIKTLFNRNKFTKGRFVINTLVTRGIAERGLMPSKNPKPQIVIRITRAPKKFAPLHAIIAKSVKQNEGSPLSQIKSINYGTAILALQEASKKGANEAILLNNRSFVTCASASNIFILKGKTFYTPPLKDGVMDGITRQMMRKKYKVVEKSLKPEHLFAADGIYLTSSIRGARPLLTLNGKKLPTPAIKIDPDFHVTL